MFRCVCSRENKTWQAVPTVWRTTPFLFHLQWIVNSKQSTMNKRLKKHQQERLVNSYVQLFLLFLQLKLIANSFCWKSFYFLDSPPFSRSATLRILVIFGFKMFTNLQFLSWRRVIEITRGRKLYNLLNRRQYKWRHFTLNWACLRFTDFKRRK